MPKVIVVGELNADLILNKLEAKPEMGKEVIARQMSLVMGSSSAIFACNLSSLGTEVVFCGKLGQDLLADLVMNTLKQRGVDTSCIMQSSEWATGISVATVEGFDRVMVTFPGAMEILREDDISDEQLIKANHLHVSSLFLQPALKEGIVKLFTRAKSIGLTTSLDPQFDPDEKWDIRLEELLPVVDVFLPNRSELAAFTGLDDAEDAMRAIAPFCNTVVMKDGEHGAYLWNQGQLYFQPAYLNQEPVDIIGAGDSFDAGFISAFINKKELNKCLDLAMLMGAVNTTGPGGTGAFEKGFDSIRDIVYKNWKIKI